MKAHLIDTHLLVSRSSAKVNIKVTFSKMALLGSLMFHKHIFFKTEFSLKIKHLDPSSGICMQYFFYVTYFMYLCEAGVKEKLDEKNIAVKVISNLLPLD